MKIQNVTRNTLLASRAEQASTFRERMMGLMFQASLPHGGGLLLEPESSIHTFFMRFPIDVLYLDRNYKVLRAEARMPPNRIGPLYTRYCYAILELPPGTIEESATRIGDELAIST